MSLHQFLRLSRCHTTFQKTKKALLKQALFENDHQFVEIIFIFLLFCLLRASKHKPQNILKKKKPRVRHKTQHSKVSKAGAQGTPSQTHGTWERAAQSLLISQKACCCLLFLKMHSRKGKKTAYELITYFLFYKLGALFSYPHF